MPSLIQAFKEDQDVHALTACDLFNLPLTAITEDLRRIAKTINFGILYGMSVYGLAQRLSISREESAQHIQTYFNRYPQMRDYMESMKQLAREQSYVLTPFGRPIATPLIHDKNPTIRQFAERAAINAPLQGGAADLIKSAMIQIDRALSLHELKADLVLQVHDELVFEVPQEQAQQASAFIQSIMERALTLIIPLKVHMNCSQHWEASHKSLS
jgi:DNA polymerase-1